VGEGFVAREGSKAGPYRLDVIGQARSGMLEGRPVTPLDVSFDLGAQAQTELPCGRLGQLPRRLGVDHGAAGKGGGYTGAQMQIGAEGDCGAGGVGAAAGFGHHDPVEAGRLGRPGQLGRLA
jgi:hypothetical protein